MELPAEVQAVGDSSICLVLEAAVGRRRVTIEVKIYAEQRRRVTTTLKALYVLEIVYSDSWTFMWAQRWAHLTEKLFESFYVACQLVCRNLLLSRASSLKQQAERHTTQASRLYALDLEFPFARFKSIKGRDLIQEPSEL